MMKWQRTQKQVQMPHSKQAVQELPKETGVQSTLREWANKRAQYRKS